MLNLANSRNKLHGETIYATGSFHYTTIVLKLKPILLSALAISHPPLQRKERHQDLFTGCIKH